MSKQYTRVLRAISERPWAITPGAMDTICAIVSARASGVAATKEEIQAALGVRAARDARSASAAAMAAPGSIAVIPVHGIITQRASIFSEYSGGCCVEEVIADVREAMAAPNISAVLLHFDTPGGTATGVMEAFDALYALRGQKPLVGICDPCAASAGLWLAAACDTLYITPSGECGSLGVYMVREDITGLNEQLGLKYSYIHAGAYKVENAPDIPMSDDSKAYLQYGVDAVYQEFLADVAQGRGKAVADVERTFGQGRTLLAADAVAVGMCDGIATCEEVLQKLASGQPARGRRRASATADGALAAEAGRTHPTGMGSRQGIGGCEACSEACKCDLDDCGDACPDCDPGCPCVAPMPDPGEDDATATAALRDAIAAKASAMDMARRRG